VVLHVSCYCITTAAALAGFVYLGNFTGDLMIGQELFGIVTKHLRCGVNIFIKRI